MKKLNGFLTGIIIFLSSFVIAQEKQVTLPESVVTKIIQELITKDHLTYEVSMLDSVVHVYEHKDSLSTVEIQKYKLGEKQYLVVVESLKQQLNIVQAENKDLKRTQTKLKIKSTVTQILTGVALAVLLWLNFKD